MAAIDQKALDKRVKERRAANKKRAEEKKIARQKKRNMRKINRMAVKAEKEKKGAGSKAVSIGKKTKIKKLSPTGKIRKGMKGVEVTEGGAYAKYGKESGAAKSFREAFAAAKGEDFTWDGRKYSGKKAEEGGRVANYSEGCKVESNPYGWPTKDARGK